MVVRRAVCVTGEHLYGDRKVPDSFSELHGVFDGGREVHSASHPIRQFPRRRSMLCRGLLLSCHIDSSLVGPGAGTSGDKPTLEDTPGPARRDSGRAGPAGGAR